MIAVQREDDKLVFSLGIYIEAIISVHQMLMAFFIAGDFDEFRGNIAKRAGKKGELLVGRMVKFFFIEGGQSTTTLYALATYKSNKVSKPIDSCNASQGTVCPRIPVLSEGRREIDVGWCGSGSKSRVILSIVGSGIIEEIETTRLKKRIWLDQKLNSSMDSELQFCGCHFAR